MDKYVVGVFIGGLFGFGLGFHLGSRNTAIYAREKIQKYKFKNEELKNIIRNTKQKDDMWESYMKEVAKDVQIRI